MRNSCQILNCVNSLIKNNIFFVSLPLGMKIPSLKVILEEIAGSAFTPYRLRSLAVATISSTVLKTVDDELYAVCVIIIWDRIKVTVGQFVVDQNPVVVRGHLDVDHSAYFGVIC